MKMQQYFYRNTNSEHHTARCDTKYSYKIESKKLSPIAYVANSIKDLKKTLQHVDLYNKSMRNSFSEFNKFLSTSIGKNESVILVFYTQNNKMRKPAIGVCLSTPRHLIDITEETTQGELLKGFSFRRVFMLSVDINISRGKNSVGLRSDYYVGNWAYMNASKGFGSFMINFDNENREVQIFARGYRKGERVAKNKDIEVYKSNSLENDILQLELESNFIIEESIKNN